MSKKSAKLSASSKIKEFPVETDPHKLVNYVCGSNIYQEGEDVKLKPESEYPEWLWSIRTGTDIIQIHSVFMFLPYLQRGCK